MQEKIIEFASDNYVSVHPKIQEAIDQSMGSIEMPYGYDAYVEHAKKEFKKTFGSKTEVFFAGTGTAANIMALRCVLRSIDAVICTNTAHINTNECGAFECFTGAKIFPVRHHMGKINTDDIDVLLQNTNSVHFNKPKVISLSQTTELGTVYDQKELEKICAFAHKNNLIVHMDGARLSNAAAFLKCTLKDITTNVGVDLLSFGATKNGCLMAESVVILNPDLCPDHLYHQKQGMQMFSKMRFLPAQFSALLKDDLWKTCAENANEMARYLGNELIQRAGVTLAYPLQSNMLFVQMPLALRDRLLKKYHFYTIDQGLQNDMCTIRLVTSFSTQQKKIDDFLSFVDSCL